MKTKKGVELVPTLLIVFIILILFAIIWGVFIAKSHGKVFGFFGGKTDEIAKGEDSDDDGVPDFLDRFPCDKENKQTCKELGKEG